MNHPQRACIVSGNHNLTNGSVVVIHGLQGIDLVCEYIRRLYMEHRFLHPHAEQLKELSRLYEKANGISLYDIQVNLFSLLAVQMYAACLCGCNPSIYLDDKEMYLQNHQNSKKRSEAEQWLMEQLPENLQTYLQTYRGELLDALPVFAQDREELIVHPRQGRTDKEYRTLLQILHDKAEAGESLNFEALDLSVYDLIDLFEEGSMEDAQMEQCLETMSVLELVVLIRCACRELGAFHCEYRSIAEVFAEIGSEWDWYALFKTELLVRTETERQEFLQLLSKIRIA